MSKSFPYKKVTQNQFMEAITESCRNGRVPFAVDLSGAMRVNFTYHGYDTVCDVGALVAANTGERTPEKDVGEQMRRAYVEGLSKTGFTVFLLGHDVPKQFPAFTKNGGGSFDMERILDMSQNKKPSTISSNYRPDTDGGVVPTPNPAAKMCVLVTAKLRSDVHKHFATASEVFGPMFGAQLELFVVTTSAFSFD